MAKTDKIIPYKPEAYIEKVGRAAKTDLGKKVLKRLAGSDAPKVSTIGSSVAKASKLATAGKVLSKVAGPVGTAITVADTGKSLYDLGVAVKGVNEAESHTNLHAKAAKRAGAEVNQSKRTVFDNFVGIPLGLESSMKKADVSVTDKKKKK